MDDKVQTPRRTAEQWQIIVDQQKYSGLSGAAFCKSEGIQYQSLMNWRTKLTPSSEVNSELPTFIELTAPEVSRGEAPGRWLIELDLPAPALSMSVVSLSSVDGVQRAKACSSSASLEKGRLY